MHRRLQIIRDALGTATPPVAAAAESAAADAHQTAFADQGFTIYRDVLDGGLVGEAKRHIEWLQEKHPELRPENFGHTLVADDPFWVRLVSDPRLLKIAADFIGQDIALFASHYIAKPPGDGQEVLWHQDGAYWPLKPMEVVTLWLAVDDSDPENGCMRVLPGTHTMELHEMVPSHKESVLGSQMNPELVDDTGAVDLVLKAGDVSVHNPRIVHGSNANHSSRRRGGLTIRYIPTTTQIGDGNAGNQEACFLLQGKPADEVMNNYKAKPKFDPAKHMAFKGCEEWA